MKARLAIYGGTLLLCGGMLFAAYSEEIRLALFPLKVEFPAPQHLAAMFRFQEVDYEFETLQKFAPETLPDAAVFRVRPAPVFDRAAADEVLEKLGYNPEEVTFDKDFGNGFRVASIGDWEFQYKGFPNHFVHKSFVVDDDSAAPDLTREDLILLGREYLKAKGFWRDDFEPTNNFDRPAPDRRGVVSRRQTIRFLRRVDGMITPEGVSLTMTPIGEVIRFGSFHGSWQETAATFDLLTVDEARQYVEEGFYLVSSEGYRLKYLKEEGGTAVLPLNEFSAHYSTTSAPFGVGTAMMLPIYNFGNLRDETAPRLQVFGFRDQMEAIKELHSKEQ